VASSALSPLQLCWKGSEDAMNDPAERSAELDPALLVLLHPAASTLAALEEVSVPMLEQLVGEPILLQVETQMQTVQPWPLEDLEAMHQYESVLVQTVRLRGARTRRVWQGVASVLMTRRVDSAVVSSLQPRAQTSEQALAAVYPENDRRRQTLGLACGPGGDKGQDFGLDAGAWLVSRRARVLVGGRPVLLVEDRFPAADGWPDVASAAGPPAG
jgi:hypothetical protein